MYPYFQNSLNKSVIWNETEGVSFILLVAVCNMPYSIGINGHMFVERCMSNYLSSDLIMCSLVHHIVHLERQI